MIYSTSVVIALLSAASVLATPAPAPTPAPNFDHAVAKRANTSCTFSGPSGYLSANASKKACSTIILSDLQVPGGKTLNLEDLNAGTVVCR